MAAHYPTELLAAVVAAEEQQTTKTTKTTKTAASHHNDLPHLCATGAVDYDSLDTAGDIEFFYDMALLSGP